jgi:hypothetical protein
MQSTLTSTETDPHDDFVVEPDVVLAARVDHAASDPISSLLAPPIHPAPELSATPPAPPVDKTFRAAVAADIEVPRDIHVSGQPARGRWAGRAVIGFLFALGSAAAAEGWDHYGDTAKAVIANWTPFVLNSAPTPEKAAAAGQPGAPDVQGSPQAAAADQAPAQPAPAAQPAPDAASTGTASASASTGAAPAVAAASPPSPPPMARDLAAMGQQIEALKASIEQLKAGQEQMAQQMARNSAARPTQARTSPATPSDIRPADQSLRAKVTAALSPRPAAPPPPRRPRPAYPPAPGYVPSQAAAALPPAIAAPMPPPQPAPVQYPRTQAVDQADGDPVVRPPMPVR